MLTRCSALWRTEERAAMATVTGFEAYLEYMRVSHPDVDEDAVRTLYEAQASELRAFWSGVTYSGLHRKLPGRAGIKRRPGPTHYNRFCRAVYPQVKARMRNAPQREIMAEAGRLWAKEDKKAWIAANPPTKEDLEAAPKQTTGFNLFQTWKHATEWKPQIKRGDMEPFAGPWAIKVKAKPLWAALSASEKADWDHKAELQNSQRSGGAVTSAKRRRK